MLPNTAPKKVSGEITVSRLNYPEKVKNVPELTKLVAQFSIKNTSELLEIIFLGAIDLDASDIHFETEQNQTKIRLRLDGVLQDLSRIQPQNYQPLLSRLKLVSGVKLNISDRPQDGRFSIVEHKITATQSAKVADLPIEIRLSTLPTEYGESLVLRILNPKSLISLEELGLRFDLLEIFRQQISKPNGMIIVTGPTGSGKTTTLYAFLKEVQDPKIKVITIEDPIEYRLEGISQTQVEPEKGYSFASGLKAIVRQDPDVILVGEIRDLETADIALQAALTGHLVFSTLHTNDAAGTIARLMDLGVEPPSIASAINSIVAQRLIRKVCKNCAESKTIPEQLFERMNRSLRSLPSNVDIPKLTKETKIPYAKGCEDCGFTGYRGRLGVFETIIVDTEMDRLIQTKPPTSSVKELAIKKGLVTMYQDGLIKVLNKVTTLDELERVVEPD